MPKITAHGGPSYAGHVDVTPHDVTEPDWYAVADEPEPALVAVVEDVAEPPAVLASPKRTRARRASL